MARSGRDEVTTLVGGLGDAVYRAVDDLSRAVASKAGDGEPPPVDVLQQEALAFGSTVAAQLERLADEIGRAAPSVAAPARQAIGGVVHYVAGWIEGGGVVLALILDLEPSLFGDAAKVSALLRPRLAFVATKTAVALAPVVETLPAAPAPPPKDEGKARLAALLARAAALGVRIKNVPDGPSPRYLEKLEAQLASVEAKRKAALGSAGDRAQRLDVLMAFADQLKVRVKQVPEAPTDGWLDKMEAKLVEVATKKGVPLPPELRPASSLETQPTGEFAPERAAAPLAPLPSFAPTLDDPTAATEKGAPLAEDRRDRVEALLEKAAEAGLDLGRVPQDPSDDWIASTEAKLEGAIERRKAERKAERKRKEAERKARIERLKAQAEELAVELGAFPPFPTDDWLARAELRIQAALLTPSDRVPADDHDRAERLDAVLAAAAEQGIDLGDLPPDPDEVWLTWAEGRVGEAEAADEAIAVESEGFEPPSAFLLFEEGTVQEQSWPVGEDEVSIGRGRGNVVQIRDDAGVSRKHCTLRQEQGRYYLRDEGSTKGTLVNGRKESGELELQGDEVILCGETKFVFRVRYGG